MVILHLNYRHTWLKGFVNENEIYLADLAGEMPMIACDDPLSIFFWNDLVKTFRKNKKLFFGPLPTRNE